MKELVLPLKKKWFEMIKSGEKMEEYREIKPYYQKRFCFYREVCKDDCDKCKGTMYARLHPVFEPYDTITFTLGYPRKDDAERRITFKNPSIRIGKGKEEWGAEKDKEYFVITWQATTFVKYKS